MDVDQLATVRARLGEAVIDPARWRDLLDALCRSVGASGASLRQNGIRTSDVPYTESMEELTKLYFRDGWQLHDTRLRKLHSMDMRAPAFHDLDVFANDELSRLLRRDPFFNDFLGRGNLRWSAWIQFRSEEHPWLVGLQRTVKEGPFSPTEISLLKPLSGALSEAANLSAAVGRSALAGAIDALQLVQKPAIALNRAGSVIGANSAAQAGFNADVLVRNGKIVVSDEKARLKFQLLFEKMNASKDVDIIGSGPIVVARAFKPPIVFRVLSVPTAARSPFLGARAILTFSDLSKMREPGASLLETAFELTPAQARLAAHLASGSSLDDASDKLRVSRETLRSQLKAIFLKTGTNRQGELIAMLSHLA